MIDLDMKDRKILYQLDLNCRQSNTQIGHKVGLSRKVVEYRINRMEEAGLIHNYFTVINSYMLGYDAYRYYIKFQNATNKIKDEIGAYVSKYKHIWTCSSIKGVYDLSIVVWVSNIQEFYNFWDDINDKYGDYFAEKLFSIYVKAHCYPNSYLLKDEYDRKERDIFQITGEDKKVDIDYIDYKILNIIAMDARISTIDIAKQINLSSQNTQYRINKLKDKNLIQAFRVNIDITKINLSHFKVDIFLNQPSKRKKLWKELKLLPNVIFINTSVGYADIEMEVIVKSSDDIIEIMDEIMSKHENLIKKYNFYTGNKFYKIRCLPELKKSDFND